MIRKIYEHPYFKYPKEQNKVITLREKCPNKELFLVRIFLYSVREAVHGKISYQ